MQKSTKMCNHTSYSWKTAAHNFQNPFLLILQLCKSALTSATYTLQKSLSSANGHIFQWNKKYQEIEKQFEKQIEKQKQT